MDAGEVGMSQVGCRGAARRYRTSRIKAVAVVVGTLVFISLAPGASVALAGVAAPHLVIHADATPTYFTEADNAQCIAEASSERPPCDTYQVTVTNAGSLAAKAPIKITEVIPAGLTVREAQLYWSGFPAKEGGEGHNIGGCTIGAEVRCTLTKALVANAGRPFEPDDTLEMKVLLTVDPGAVSSPGTVTVKEGEGSGPEATTTANSIISVAPAPFGPSAFVAPMTGPEGEADVQAGDHPYEYTTRIDLNSQVRLGPESQRLATSVHEVKDVVVDLPLGFLGGAQAAPKCTFAELITLAGCPADTQVGHILSEPKSSASVNSGIYNMVPEGGVSAEFGYIDALYNSHAIFASVAPTPSGYVLRATSPDVPQVPLTDVNVTFYGDPAAKDGSAEAPAAMFTNPSDCSGEPLKSTIYMDSWEEPGSFNADGTPDLEGPGWASETSETPAVTGCEDLVFSPEAFTVRPVQEGPESPATTAADTPTGLNFDLKLPQSETPGTLATPPLRAASVTLPPGLTGNPSLANGLEACSEAQIGWLGGSITNFTPDAPTCPDNSQLGTVELTTPLLEGTIKGAVYLASPAPQGETGQNPFNTLLAGYVVVNDPRTGIVVKIAGNLTPNPTTGQITGTFDENPQLPFSELKLHFFGGQRGDLATPEGCGTYTTTSDFSPWSAPASGPDATPSDNFEINSGCVSGLTPAFSAGTVSPQALSYSPFTLTLSRADSEEGFAGLSVALPSGLVGKLAGVAECPEAAIAAAGAKTGAAERANPSCPASSQLGTVEAAAGPGSEPYYDSGVAYLTGPYKGAPYGIAVIIPAVAGPFDLGTVVIRQALEVDPTDAHVTDVSDPFPTILRGIPLRIQRVEVMINRSDFMFTPTNCEPQSIHATVSGIGGGQAALSNGFRSVGCASLPFKPVFAASTGGKASKLGGTSLTVKVSSKGGPQPGGGEANIRSVKVDLPKQLPSRNETLQKACLAKVFEANPAACPKESAIGTATAVTPILEQPLSGPAYLVSYGGAKFPDLVLVLQGDGITLRLDGNTDIKKGITSNTFKTLPDAPISSFELKLPAGRYSALTAFVPEKDNYNLCGQKLNMPTAITGQNGAVIKKTTKIAVTGCPKKKAKQKTKGKQARRKSHKRS